MCSAPTSAWCSRSSAARGAIALLLFAVAIGARAQGPQLAVRLAIPGAVEARSRDTVSLALQCSNEGTSTRSLTIAPTLPPGWRPVGTADRFVLDAGADDVRIVSFLVPSMAPAGDYLIQYELRDVDDPLATAVCALRVTVLPEIALRIDVLEAPSSVLAGEEYETRFALVNTGNVDLAIDLEVQCGQSMPCRVLNLDSLEGIALLVGTRRELQVAVQTPATIPRSERQHVRLVARHQGASDRSQPPLSTATSIVEVIALNVAGGSRYHTIPLSLETTVGAAITPGFSARIQERIKASGSLDEWGEHRIDLELRKQLATDQNPWNNPYDLYSIRYRQRFAELLLGDQAYTISPLLLMDEFARGAGATLFLDPLRVSTLLYEDIRDPERKHGLGGSVGFTIPGAAPGDGVLYRASVGVLSPLTDTVQLGLWQQYHPWPTLQLQLDTALQIEADGRLSPAVLALSQGGFGPVSWSARLLRAWPGFEGVFRDTQSVSAGAGVRLFQDALKLKADLSLADSNLLLDAGLPSAERLLHGSVLATGNLSGWSAQASLGWDLYRRLDRLAAPAFDTWENRFRISWQQEFVPFTGTLASTLSLVRDELADNLVSLLRNTLSFELAPSPTSTSVLSLSLDRRQVGAQTALYNASLSLGVSLSFPRTELDAKLRNGYSFAATGFGGAFVGFDGKLLHVLPWGHEMTVTGDLSVEYQVPTWTPNASLSLGYRVPVEVPVSRKRGAARISGTVIREETGIPLEGIILRLNGLAAATGARGEFAFHPDRSGELYLQIDRRTLGAGLIPTQSMPRAVEVIPGADVRLSLSVVAGCTVSGSVSRYSYRSEAEGFINDGADGAAASQLRREGGLGGMVVELSDGNERKRRVTNMDGRFEFLEVRPGTWSISIIGGQVPSYHVIEQPQRSITLAPGEKLEIEFRAVQEQRRIQMVDVGDYALVESETRPAAELVIRLGEEEPPAMAAGQSAESTSAPGAAAPTVEPAAEPASAPPPGGAAPPEVAETAAVEPAPAVEAAAPPEVAETAAVEPAPAAEAAAPPEVAETAAVEPAPAAEAAAPPEVAVEKLPPATAPATEAPAPQAAPSPKPAAPSLSIRARGKASGPTAVLATARVKVTLAKVALPAATLSGAESPVTGAPKPAAGPEITIPAPSPTPRPFVPAPRPTPNPTPSPDPIIIPEPQPTPVP